MARSGPEDEGYDGRFRFVRLRWDGGGAFGRRGMSNAWNHDYPRAEANLARILQELTLIDVNPEGRILGLDDPEVFNYPILYMWEPGFWIMTDRQGEHFREYLLKGGFAIFDDFEYDQWNNLEAQMRRILPEARWVQLDASHRIFDSFFRMEHIDFPHPMYGIKPTYYGIFEDNDPSKRLMVIANHNHDVAEYLGVLRPGPLANRPVQRSVQARRQLHGVRPDSLSIYDFNTRLPRLSRNVVIQTAIGIHGRSARSVSRRMPSELRIAVTTPMAPMTK